MMAPSRESSRCSSPWRVTPVASCMLAPSRLSGSLSDSLGPTLQLKPRRHPLVGNRLDPREHPAMGVDAQVGCERHPTRLIDGSACASSFDSIRAVVAEVVGELGGNLPVK